MPTVDEATSQPSKKVTAAAIGAGVGAALYAIAETKLDFLKMPEVKGGLMPLVASAFALGPAWFKRNLSVLSQEKHAGRNWWVMIGGVVAVAALGLVVGYMVH